MKAFLSYQGKSFLYSLQWMPPIVLYVIWIFLQYNYKNVPMLDSYSLTAASLYIAMIWLSMKLFSLEKGNEKIILYSYFPKRLHFLYGKIIILAGVGFSLMGVSYILPVVLDIFNEPITAVSIGLFLYSHIVFICFGICTGGLFSLTGLAGKKYTWVAAALFTCTAIASSSIAEKLPDYVSWLLYILPPVSAVTGLMANGVRAHFAENAWVIVYILSFFFLLCKLFLKREQRI